MCKYLCAYNSWGSCFACKRFGVRTSVSKLQTNVCECLMPLQRPRKGSQKSCLYSWPGRTSTGLAKTRETVRKRKTALLPTVPSPRRLCLLPAPQRKQRVEGRIGVVGSSVCSPSTFLLPEVGRLCKTLLPSLRGHEAPPGGLSLLAAAPSAGPLLRSPSALEPFNPSRTRCHRSRPAPRGQRGSSCVSPSACRRHHTPNNNGWGKGGTASSCVPHGHCSGEASPG